MADSRASYWNEVYHDYWASRVAESDQDGTSLVQSGDSKTEGDWVYEKVFELAPFQGTTVLDVGCAWGRMFPIYHNHNLLVCGVDISHSMIASAEKQWSSHQFVDRLNVAVAESLPFQSKSFDNLVCVAVFDATFQNKALREFLRVLKPGGNLYITGKNSNYHLDDHLAINAEVGARNKQHPNFFTDCKKMIDLLLSLGCNIKRSFYFPRRGDFAEFNFVEIPPEIFYEWFLVVSVPDLDESLIRQFENFSSDYSSTFLSLQASQ